MKLTNREIIEICKDEQERQTHDDYPGYKFSVKQTPRAIKIYWEYLEGGCWTINKDSCMVRDEHGELMNNHLEFDQTIGETIRSCVYYMVTRY